MLYFLWGVVSNPAHKSRLEKEVRACAVGPDGIIPYSITSKLPFMEACLNETLRRWPGIISGTPE